MGKLFYINFILYTRFSNFMINKEDTITYFQITGDVQIRLEPTICVSKEMKKENMYQLGQISRRLLASLVSGAHTLSGDT